MITKIETYKCTCNICGHTWIPMLKTSKIPRACAKCSNSSWNDVYTDCAKNPKYDYCYKTTCERYPHCHEIFTSEQNRYISENKAAKTKRNFKKIEMRIKPESPLFLSSVFQ